ncbi:MAG: hypothetical protein Q8N18_06220 [Opitutaceae bacterium]|nr:hypothetical protein [Opitutaceae bacterium]
MSLEFHHDVQHRWLASLICGALAIGAMVMIPIIGMTFGGPLLLMAAFSGLGILTGLLSLAANEKRKNFAYAGFALCALPWVIFGTKIVTHAMRQLT